MTAIEARAARLCLHRFEHMIGPSSSRRLIAAFCRLSMVLLVLGIVAACGGSGASAPTVTFTARDYGFSGPSSIHAGVTRFRLVNQGQHAHQLGLIALGGGKTASDLFTDLQKKSEDPLPAYANWAGGPNATDGGGTSTAFADLAPGAYAVVCFMPDGNTGQKHVNRGMIQGLTVTDARQGGRAPRASVVLDEQGFRFSTAGTIGTATQTIQVRNGGQQDHEVQLDRLPGSVTVGQYIALNDATNATSGSSYGGFASIRPGKDGLFTADFTPGKYAFICFATDPHSGKAHFELGMISEFTVK